MLASPYRGEFLPLKSVENACMLNLDQSDFPSRKSGQQKKQKYINKKLEPLQQHSGINSQPGLLSQDEKQLRRNHPSVCSSSDDFRHEMPVSSSYSRHSFVSRESIKVPSFSSLPSSLQPLFYPKHPSA
jgi:hypothetical protein